MKINVQKELRRIVRDALTPLGGTGGQRECRYCGRRSFPGQVAHYRKDFPSKEPGCDVESNDHCVVIVAQAALREMA